MKNEIIEAIEKHSLMDFVSSRRHLLSKDNLVDIIKEYDYVIYSSTTEKEFSNVMKKLKEAIEELEMY